VSVSETEAFISSAVFFISSDAQDASSLDTSNESNIFCKSSEVASPHKSSQPAGASVQTSVQASAQAAISSIFATWSQAASTGGITSAGGVSTGGVPAVSTGGTTDDQSAAPQPKYKSKSFSGNMSF